MRYDWETIKAFVCSKQSSKRYKHTLGVANEALSLGRIFLPQKLEKLYLASLLHDVTKDFEKEKQLDMCREFNIILKENTAPKLLHSKTGAAYSRSYFGDEMIDDEVYNGILYHTTGKAEMSLFEIIIYLADYIEEGRTFEDCVYLRNFFYDNLKNMSTFNEKLEVLRQTMILSFDLTIKNLISENKSIDFDTVTARNYFLKTKF